VGNSRREAVTRVSPLSSSGVALELRADPNYSLRTFIRSRHMLLYLARIGILDYIEMYED
jgi:hypothetical protein